MLVAGVSGSLAVWRVVVEQDRARRAGLLGQRAAEAALAVREEVRRVTDLVDAVGGLLTASPGLSREALNAYLADRDLSAEYAGLVAVAYVQPVDEDGLAQAEQALDDPAATLTLGIPPGTRGDRMLVTAGLPADGAPLTLGQLPTDIPEQTAALRDARENGTAALSAAHVLARDRRLPSERQQRGFMLVAPVYAGPVPSTVRGRIAALQGYVVAAFRGGDLLADVLRVSGRNLHIELLDGTPSAARAVGRVHDGAAPEVGEAAPSGRGVAMPIAIGGRTLTLRLQPLAGFSPTSPRNAPTWALLSGLSLTFLLALSARVLANGQRHALGMVARATASLQTAKHDLEARQLFVDTLLDTIDVGIVACDEQGRPTYANRRAREAEEGGWRAVDDDGRPLTAEQEPLTRVLRDGAVRGLELRLARPGDAVNEWVLNGAPLQRPDGGLMGAVVAGHDVTAQRENERALRRSEERFRTVFARGLVGMAVADEHGRFLEVNDAICDMLGLSRKRLLGRAALEFCHPEDRVLVAGIERMLAAGNGIHQAEQRLVRSDGDTVVSLVSVLPLPSEGGGSLQLWQVADITAQKAAEQQLSFRALHDELTGLPNRALLLERLGSALERYRRRQHSVAVVFLDLDGFKGVNDTYGHEAGDALLREIGRRLEEVVRGSDTASRLGGDEFVVLLEDLREGEVTRIVSRLRDACAEPVRYGAQRLVVSASAGITFLAPHHATPADVLREADAAMYQAKAARRDALDRRLPLPTGPAIEARP